MSIPENFPTYPQADLVREIQRLGVENKRMNQRLVWADREVERWRHGVTVEGDYVCPDSLRMTELESALHALASGLRWEEELRAWVLTDLGALTRARQALSATRHGGET